MNPQDYSYFNVRTAAILTTSYVAGTTLTPSLATPHKLNQLNVYVKFTKGSLTSGQVKIEFSHNGTDWYQETFDAVSGGTDTHTLGEHSFTADGNYRISVPIKDNYVKISAKGTGTVTSSSMTIDAVLGVA